MRMIARLMSVAVIVATLAGLTGCTETPLRTVSGIGWGTSFHVTYRADVDLEDSIHYIIRSVDESLSPFNAESLVSQLNAGDSVLCDTLLKEVFILSQEINRLSGGVFDPTLGPIINLWGFGTDREGKVPAFCQIDSALSLVGINECEITDGAIVKKSPGTQFNFSAVAKGYGVDLIARMLERNGVEDYLVEVGGEIATAGAPGDGRDAWVVQIDAPVVDNGANHTALCYIKINKGRIATSGNYRNYRTDDEGRLYSHTISPVDGRPVMGRTLSATVMAEDCAMADALATCAMAMGREEFMAMISVLPGVEAMIVEENEEDDEEPSYIIYVSPGSPEIEKANTKIKIL